MIVVDASALLEFLLQTPLGVRVEAVYGRSDDCHAPHLIDVEITQALRRLVREGELSSTRAAEALQDLGDVDLHRHPHGDLLARAWAMRNNITAYDAMYVALAEALDARLITCDRRLAHASGHRAAIELID